MMTCLDTHCDVCSVAVSDVEALAVHFKTEHPGL